MSGRTPILGSGCVGARLLFEISESSSGLHFRLVERRSMGTCGQQLHIPLPRGQHFRQLTLANLTQRHLRRVLQVGGLAKLACAACSVIRVKSVNDLDKHHLMTKEARLPCP